MKLVWSERALRRLKAEAALIAGDRPLAARRFVQQVRDAIGRLSDFPLSGRLVPEIPDEFVREVIVGQYRVLYRPEPDCVTVLHLLHVRQQLRGEDVTDRG